MSFTPVRYSQNDPRWAAKNLGFSSETLGQSGCAITSVAMVLSGFGYMETPDTLNEKLKARGGYLNQNWIVWGAVSVIQPQVTFKNIVINYGADAPLAQIDAALAAGQPVIVQVDFAPSTALDTHWVVLYEKRGNDYLILDPWPNPVETDEVLLMQRYSHGRSLARTITAVVWYECLSTGSGTPPPPPPAAVETNLFLEVIDGIASPGLRLRSAGSLNSDTLGFNESGTRLRVIEAENIARTKVGVYDQWIRVRDPQNREGYVAAWFTEYAGASPVVIPSTPSASTSNTSVSQPTVIKRTKKSLGEGLENVALVPAVAKQITKTASMSATQKLVADIWNKYGGLLEPLSNALDIEPGVAVATLAVESGGQAFGADGRMIIRFENHLFWDFWGKNNQQTFNNHFRFSSTQRWQDHQWRPSSSEAWRDFHGNQAKEWEVLTFARGLNEQAAKMSISMGAPQIMGFNHSIIGFATVDDMFADFSEGERDQVVGFFDFVRYVNANAVPALKNRDFRAFAVTYNGSGQADYYGNLIKNTYDAFQALMSAPAPAAPSTPATPTQPATPSQPAVPSTPVTPTAPTTPTTPSTPVTPSTPKPPTPPPDADEPALTVYVMPSVGTSGLRLRNQPSLGGALVTVVKASRPLTVLEPASKARAKIGKQNQWIEVREGGGKTGYAAAWLVTETLASTPAAPATPTQPVTPATPATPSTPSTPAAPATPSGEFAVKVLASVGSSGLRIRKEPSTGAALVVIAPAGSRLVVLDLEAVARPKIGKQGQWLWVQDRKGNKGYVAAWLVEAEKPAATTGGSAPTVFVGPLAKEAGGLRMRKTPDANGALIKTLAVNAPLTVLEDPAEAEKKIGVFNQWLKVRDALNTEGYVAAWYVVK